MCFDSIGRSIGLAVPLVLLTIVSARAGDGSSKDSYSSPKTVFNAYREASAKRDRRKLFACYTPRVQDFIVCNSYFVCVERNSKEDIAALNKYVDEARIKQEYEKKYEAKHGVDLGKLLKEHGNDPNFVPPPRDDQLWVDAVVANVKNKLEFVEAVAKVTERKPVPRRGDLEGLVIQGDTATGHAKETLLPDVEAGETPLKPGESPAVYDRPFKFRRINGGWLIDSL